MSYKLMIDKINDSKFRQNILACLHSISKGSIGKCQMTCTSCPYDRYNYTLNGKLQDRDFCDRLTYDNRENLLEEVEINLKHVCKVYNIK